MFADARIQGSSERVRDRDIYRHCTAMERSYNLSRLCAEISQPLQEYIREIERIRRGYSDIELPRQNYAAITGNTRRDRNEYTVMFADARIQGSSERIRDRRITDIKLRAGYLQALD
jgi:hypothetical protein